MDADREARRLKVIYQAAANELAALLRAQDPALFTEGAAVRIRDRVDSLIASLDGSAKAWVTRALAAAYEAQQKVTRNRLLIMGREKAKRFHEARHEKAKAALIKQTLKDLYKANRSIRDIAEQTIGLLAEGRRGIEKLQAMTGAEKKMIGGWADEAVKEGLTRQTLKNQIRDYLAEKLKGRDFIRINGRNYNAGKYAELVARVRMREAATDATKNSAKEYDHDLVEIPAQGGACDICQEIEGKIYSISGNDPGYEALTEENTPPVHPNCLLPGTRVISPGGFVAGQRAMFRGEAIKLTFADGTRLSVTPNHMLLTPRGFASADLLREGDDVFYCGGFEGIASHHPDIDQFPTVVEDIFRALQEARGMATRTVPCSSEYLHGDGRFCYGDIDVVGTDSLLRDAGISASAEKMGKIEFGGTDIGLFDFPRSGDLAPVLKRLALATDGIMGGLRTPSAYFSGRASGRNSVGLSGRSLNQAAGADQRLQSAIDKLISNSEVLGKIAFEIPGLIETKKLIHVDRFFYHGFVYDLQTPTTLYIGNRIVSSNCRHYIRVTSPSELSFRRTP